MKESPTAAAAPKNNANDIFNRLKTQFLENLPEDDRDAYQRFGEKFHSSFNVNTGHPRDLSTIDMEESLAYVVESLKSGLHPKYLTEDEQMLLQAGYGDNWYEKWGYEKKDLE